VTTTDDYLKLTTYFAERLRHEHRFVADALLDLYGDSAVAISVMLRGIASFGPHHHLRTDETLTGSEDPPIAIAAVDSADKISALAEQTVATIPRGLITLERAQLIRRQSPAPTVTDSCKLTVYVGRHHRVAGVPAYRAVCDLLYQHGFAWATVFLGVDGTAHGQRRRAAFFSRNTEVPLMIIGLGTGAQVNAVLGELTGLLENPLLTVERAQLCKRGGKLLARPAELPETDAEGRRLWQKLMIHTSETAHHDGVPVHRAIVRRLMQTGSAGGATVLRAVWGYSGEGKPHGDRLIQFGRQVPVATIVVDTPQRIAASFEIVDDLTREHGVVSAEMVPSATVVDAGHRLGGTDLARFSY
jgi:PII-like signaling protein